METQPHKPPNTEFATQTTMETQPHKPPTTEFATQTTDACEYHHFLVKLILFSNCNIRKMVAWLCAVKPLKVVIFGNCEDQCKTLQ